MALQQHLRAAHGGGGGGGGEIITHDLLRLRSLHPGAGAVSLYAGDASARIVLTSCAGALQRARGDRVRAAPYCSALVCVCGLAVVGTLTARGDAELRAGGTAASVNVGVRCLAARAGDPFDLAQYSPDDVACGSWGGAGAPLCALHGDELKDYAERLDLYDDDSAAQGRVHPGATGLVLACMHVLAVPGPVQWRLVTVEQRAEAVDVTRGLMALARLRESTDTATVPLRGGGCRRCDARPRTTRPRFCSGLVVEP